MVEGPSQSPMVQGSVLKSLQLKYEAGDVKRTNIWEEWELMRR